MLRRDASAGMLNYRSDKDRSQSAVQSVNRAINILSCLGDGINTLTDIAHDCNLSKSTVHRLLSALEGSHLAMQDEGSHRYYLGPPPTTHEYLITCAIGEMTRLWDIVEETVTLCVMVALQHVILHEIPSKHDLRVTEENRRLGSLYAGATVKVLLAQFNAEQMEAVMRHINITHITGSTVTDKAVLAAQVKEARQRGYSITYGEKIPGAMGMAVPVLHYPYPAALSFIGPVARISPRINDFLKELKESGRKISDNVADVLKS